MFLADDVLEKLICSSCEQYLSVKPVKVYPNRQVKCGRCSEDNDGGVISSHYETVIKDLKFPCINRYEGCRVRLKCSEMDAHEELCPIQVGCYICPICTSFDGTAFMMLVHFKNDHPKNILNQKIDFSVDLDKNQEHIYLYTTKNSLQDSMALVYLKYDNMLKKLAFNLQLFCSEETKISRNYSFTLSSVTGSDVKFKSTKTKCLPFRNQVNIEDIIDIDPSVYPKNLLQCTFFIEDFPTNLDIKPETCEILSGNIKLRHCFKNIRNFEMRSYSPQYNICGAIWTVFLSRDTDHNDKEFLGVYLELQECNQDSFCFKACVNYQLISAKIKKTKLQEGQFLYKNLGDAFGYPEFLSFDRLLEPKNGYLTDQDSITFEFDITVAPYVEEKTFCKCDCKCCKNTDVCPGKENVKEVT